MEYLDIAILGVMLLSVCFGYCRGMVKEGLSILSWILAFFLAKELAYYLAPFITIEIADVPQEQVGYALAFLICFIVLIFLFGFIINAIKKLLHAINLAGVDRVLGICFGLLRGVLVVLLLGWLGLKFELQQHTWWSNAYSAPYLEQIVATAADAASGATIKINQSWF